MAVDINATRRQRAWDAVTDRSSTRTWQRRVRGADYSLEITLPQLRSLHGGMVVSVDVLVTRNGQPIYDDRINSPNPPLGVRDADGTVGENPLQAFREHIVDVVRAATGDLTRPHLMRDENGQLKGDTLAVRSATADGRVQSTSTGGTWSAARNGATLAARSATNPETIVASVSGSDYIAAQFFMDFDTSSLGAGATLSNGVFTLYGSGTAETNTNSYDIQIRPFNFGGSVTTADWIDCNPTTGWTNPTLMAHLALGSWNQTSGTANNFTVDSYADVSLTGNTYVVMGLSGLGSTTSPTGANSLEFRTADQTGTTSDPLLTVTYTPGAVNVSITSVAATATSQGEAPTPTVAPDAVTATVTAQGEAPAPAISADSAASTATTGAESPIIVIAVDATAAAATSQGEAPTVSIVADGGDIVITSEVATATAEANAPGTSIAESSVTATAEAEAHAPTPAISMLAITVEIAAEANAPTTIHDLNAIAATVVAVANTPTPQITILAVEATATADAAAPTVYIVIGPAVVIWAVARDIASIFASARDVSSVELTAYDVGAIVSVAEDQDSIAATAYDVGSIIGEAQDG